ncbi:MAG: hypothetical protein AAF460_03885 [Pseudomonadota bacterium]
MTALPGILAALGAVVCITIERLADRTWDAVLSQDTRIALAAALAAAGVSFALCLTPRRPLRDTGFALFSSATVGGLVYGQLHLDTLDAYSVTTVLIALGIALPLYQASGPHPRSLYTALHRHAWTNIIVGGLSLVFVAVAFACAFLLAALFALVDIDLLKEWLENVTFNAGLAGAAGGAAAGVLRQHHGVVSATQGVVQSVLSILAVPVGIGLPVFLLALGSTGLSPLWAADWSATVTVLGAASLAVLLANSVLRSSDEDVTGNPVTRLAARALSLCVLPLTAIASIALALRVEAHGLTPERIWGGIAIAVALLYGLAYGVALLPGTLWMNRVRQGNVVLATLVCALALILATPVLDLGAMAARQQLARLSAGEVAVERFDAAALAHEFGPGGRRVLTAFDAGSNAALAERIAVALQDDGKQQQALSTLRATLAVRPEGQTPPQALLELLISRRACEGSYCHLVLTPTHAMTVSDTCYRRNRRCQPSVRHFSLSESGWGPFYGHHDAIESDQTAELNRAGAAGDISLRTVTRAQVYIGDTPVGQPFKPAPFAELLD